MRGLAEDRAATLRGVELLGPARTIDEVRVVERVDHTHRAEIAAGDQRARAQDRRIERMTVADHEIHARRLRGRHHRGAFLERERHRLLDQHVLAASHREDRVLRMVLMRRRHVDDLDRRIGTKGFDRVVGLRRKVRREACPRLGARVGCRDQRDARVGHEGRQHDGEGAAKSRDADPQPALPGHRCPACEFSLEYLDI